MRRVLRQLVPPIAVDAIRYCADLTRKRQQRSSLQFETIDPVAPVVHAVPSPGAVPAGEWEAVPIPSKFGRVLGGGRATSVVSTQLSKWPRFLKSLEGASLFGQSHEGSSETPADLATHNTIYHFWLRSRTCCAGPQHGQRSRLGWWARTLLYLCTRANADVLDYVVKDLPPFCEAGAALLPEVTFLSDEDAALGRSYDFVFASSSVHYTRDHYG